MASNKKKIIISHDSAMDRIATDPHHNGGVEWGWITRRRELYVRRVSSKPTNPNPWEIVNRIHVTPARIALLDKLINR